MPTHLARRVPFAGKMTQGAKVPRAPSCSLHDRTTILQNGSRDNCIRCQIPHGKYRPSEGCCPSDQPRTGKYSTTTPATTLSWKQYSVFGFALLRSYFSGVLGRTLLRHPGLRLFVPTVQGVAEPGDHGRFHNQEADERYPLLAQHQIKEHEKSVDQSRRFPVAWGERMLPTDPRRQRHRAPPAAR
jgi:hypothetical protein